MRKTLWVGVAVPLQQRAAGCQVQLQTRKLRRLMRMLCQTMFQLKPPIYKISSYDLLCLGAMVSTFMFFRDDTE